MGSHGTGWTVVVEHPEVPMDHHTAERGQRGPVVGRKNDYGSGAVWAGPLAAMLFSLVQTLCLGRRNPRAWLTAYRSAGAEAGGVAPGAVERFWPGNRSEEGRRRWSLADAKAGEDTS